MIRRAIMVVIVLPLWLAGCLATGRGDAVSVPSATPGWTERGTRSEELPTPQLFGIGLDISEP